MAAPKAHDMHDRQAEKAAGKTSPPDQASHAVADKAGEAVPKGTPDSGRHATETATKKG